MTLLLNQNRGAPCGQHKAEIIHQLRQLAKIELSFDFDHGDAKPPIGFQSHIPKQLIQKENECNSCDHEVEFVFPTYEVKGFSSLVSMFFYSESFVVVGDLI